MFKILEIPTFCCIVVAEMDEFYSDDFFNGNGPLGWSEKDWFAYLKKSEAEISRFAKLYSINKMKGKTLEEITHLAGWPMPENDESYFEIDDDAEFSEEPWTLLNHPVYIITRGLLKCLQEYLEKVIGETGIPAMLVWEISKIITETSTFMALAANSTDLSEDLLARCNYKMSAVKLNEIIAKTSQIPEPKSAQGKERLRRINGIIFDLRQLCLNLAEAPITKH